MERSDQQIQDLRRLAYLMDRQFAGPFGWRFGWDGIIGLFPILGDLTTNLISGYIILRAVQIGCSASVIVRMAMNLFLENLVDLIPFFGNLFDLVWKANTRNLALVEAFVANPARVKRHSKIWIAITVFALLAMVISTLALAVYTFFIVVQWLISLPMPTF